MPCSSLDLSKASLPEPQAWLSIPAVRGDTLGPIIFRFVTVQDDGFTRLPIDLTGASARMQIRVTREHPALVSLSVGSGLTLNDPTDGQLTLDGFIFDQQAGEYAYDLEVTDAQSSRKTRIHGTIVVRDDITH